MSSFDPQAYGAVVAPLLATNRRRPLDAGTPDTGARAALDELSTKTTFAHAKVVDRDMAACCISGVWLLHDFLDESHAISQGIETPSGSFWHAIMHRREGDFSNAKYWLRRVGRHSVFDRIAACVDASLRDANTSLGETRPLEGRHWDPFAFVDQCEAAVEGQRDNSELCLDVQQAEWELLFDYCYRGAVGA